MQIQNSTFVVTGGSSGLGQATVEMIVAAGGNAVIADVNKGAGEALEAKLGKQTRFAECDVTSEEHAKRTVELPGKPSAACTDSSTAPAWASPRKCSARTDRTRSTASPKWSASI